VGTYAHVCTVLDESEEISILLNGVVYLPGENQDGFISVS
jgi:hypothetical protein